MNKMVDGVIIALTDAEIAEFNAEKLANDEIKKATGYIRKRKDEYPPMEDYLDGIVKNDQTQIDKYISDCQAVKDKYPKP